MTTMPRDVHPGGAALWAAHSAPLALPLLQEETRADVCVIGLGGSGLTAIHALLDSGLDVVGLDAGAVASAQKPTALIGTARRSLRVRPL